MLQNQKLLRVSSVLFMVQSFTWCLFSFLCILCIEGGIEIINYGNDEYSKFLLNNIYLLFFTKDLTNLHNESSMVVKPTVFEAFAFIHLFLAISWFISSAIIFCSSTHNRIHSLNNSMLLKYWLLNGYVVALVDGIFTILLMIDMIEITRVNNLTFCARIMPAVGLVFTIVSRGFTLWILNLTFIVKLTRGAWTNPSKFRHSEFETRYGNQYDNNAYVHNGYQATNPPVTQQSQYIYQPTAQQYSGERMAPAHQDFEPYRQGDTGHALNASAYPTAAPVAPYAQINKNPAPGRQSPPRLHAIPPPQIPEPDYNMGPRTVLKNRSQYDNRY